jgi:hypothetical protein
MRRYAVTAAILGGVLTAGVAPAFAAGQVQLNVRVVGSGSVQGAGINCPTTCTTAYPQRTTVTLTARPGPGAGFAGWQGACAGTAPQCQVSLDSNKTATAVFVPR